MNRYLLAVFCGFMGPWPMPTHCRAEITGEEQVQAARTFRAGGQPVVPAPDGTIFCEAEEFRLAAAKAGAVEGWSAGYWGQNYYAATLANTFLSRKRFSERPSNARKAWPRSTWTCRWPAATWCCRYEVVYRFETQFRVKIEQDGREKFNRLDGARDNLKIWAFGQKIQKEVGWSWGAVENVVWEGHDAYVDLPAGRADAQPDGRTAAGSQAKRNIDLVMLDAGRCQDQDAHREGRIPSAGWYVDPGRRRLDKSEERGDAPVSLKSFNGPGGPFQQHSPYWVHMRNWKAVSVTAQPGQSTDWIEVGSTMGSLNDGQWGFESSGPCEVEVGVRDADGKIKSIRSFQVNGELPLVGYADVRYSLHAETRSEATRELFDYLKALPVHGSPLQLTYVHASGGLPEEFYDFYGVNGANLKGAGATTTGGGWTFLNSRNSAGNSARRNGRTFWR